MKYDQETSQALQQGQRLASIVDSDDWVELRSILEAKMHTLYVDVDMHQPNEVLGENVKANQKAIKVLEDFIAQIEGSAYQFEANKDLLFDTPDLYSRD